MLKFLLDAWKVAFFLFDFPSYQYLTCHWLVYSLLQRVHKENWARDIANPTMVLRRFYICRIGLIRRLILPLFLLVIFVSYMVPNKSTFRLFVQEKSHVSSGANSLGIIETEQTRDISDDVFMGGFSTSPTTTISEAELEWAKATEDFSKNVFMRKMRKFISQAKLAKPKATSHKRPQNKLVRKVSTSSTETISIQSTAELASTKATTDIPITLFVRMAGKLPDHRHRYLCDLFRTTVLYWPSSYGKIVLVLDDEARQDHEFGDKIISETKKYFPDRKLEVLYEALPKHRSTLNFPGSPKSPGYNRQLWSSFFYWLVFEWLRYCVDGHGRRIFYPSN